MDEISRFDEQSSTIIADDGLNTNPAKACVPVNVNFAYNIETFLNLDILSQNTEYCVDNS